MLQFIKNFIELPNKTEHNINARKDFEELGIRFMQREPEIKTIIE